MAGNPYQAYPCEVPTVLVEHFAAGKGEGRINATDHNPDIHGAMLSTPQRDHESAFEEWDAAARADQHPDVYPESRGDYARTHDAFRDVR